MRSFRRIRPTRGKLSNPYATRDMLCGSGIGVACALHDSPIAPFLAGVDQQADLKVAPIGAIAVSSTMWPTGITVSHVRWPYQYFYRISCSFLILQTRSRSL